MDKIVHTGTGVLVYDPHRPGMKRRTEWWCVINTDNEIARYYRWWPEYQYHIRLQPPAWGAHISVVRGERPRFDKRDVWKKYQGQRVEFVYDHIGHYRVDRSQRTDDDARNAVGGDYYFVDVKCPMLDDIRSELGLRTGYNYHITIGRTYEYVSKYANRQRK